MSNPRDTMEVARRRSERTTPTNTAVVTTTIKLKRRLKFPRKPIKPRTSKIFENLEEKTDANGKELGRFERKLGKLLQVRKSVLMESNNEGICERKEPEGPEKLRNSEDTFRAPSAICKLEEPNEMSKLIQIKTPENVWKPRGGLEKRPGSPVLGAFAVYSDDDEDDEEIIELSSDESEHPLPSDEDGVEIIELSSDESEHDVPTDEDDKKNIKFFACESEFAVPEDEDKEIIGLSSDESDLAAPSDEDEDEDDDEDEDEDDDEDEEIIELFADGSADDLLSAFTRN